MRLVENERRPMPHGLRNLALSHDGPVPPAERARLRWGARAWERLARGADAALLEARLRECVAALGRLRRLALSRGSRSDALERLVRNIASYRSAAAGSRG